MCVDKQNEDAIAEARALYVNYKRVSCVRRRDGEDIQRAFALPKDVCKSARICVEHEPGDASRLKTCAFPSDDKAPGRVRLTANAFRESHSRTSL